MNNSEMQDINKENNSNYKDEKIQIVNNDCHKDYIDTIFKNFFSICNFNENFNLSLKKITTGLTNHIYLAIIDILNNDYNKRNNQIIKDKYMVKIFGNANKYIDREFENFVIYIAGKKSITCEQYFFNNEYKIEEFLDGYNEINNKFIDINKSNIIKMIFDFNLISILYFENLNISHKVENINYHILKNDEYSSSIYDYISKKSDKCISKYMIPTFILEHRNELLHILNDKIENLCLYEKLDTINDMIEDQNLKDELKQIIINNSNFQIFLKERINKKKKILDFLKIFNLEKYLNKDHIYVLCHNDLHKQNILANDSNFKFIDFEFTKYSLLGSDIVNFLIEYNYEYKSHGFEFNHSINIKEIYYEYHAIMNNFMKHYNENVNDEKIKKKLQELENYYLSYEYFITLSELTTYLWCIGIKNINKFDSEKIKSIKIDDNLDKIREIFEDKNIDYTNYLYTRINMITPVKN